MPDLMEHNLELLQVSGFHLEKCPGVGRGGNWRNLDFKGVGHDGLKCDIQ